MIELIFFSVVIISIIVIIIVLYNWIHADNTNIIDEEDFDDYILNELLQDREKLFERYHDLSAKINEVPSKYFDVTYQELKAVERSLEANREHLAMENYIADFIPVRSSDNAE